MRRLLSSLTAPTSIAGFLWVLQFPPDSCNNMGPMRGALYWTSRENNSRKNELHRSGTKTAPKSAFYVGTNAQSEMIFEPMQELSGIPGTPSSKSGPFLNVHTRPKYFVSA